EPKSLSPEGGFCSAETRGLLRRRPVIATTVRYIGKESNKLDDRKAGLVHDTHEIVTEYRDPPRDPWLECVVPVLQRMPLENLLCSTGLSERGLREARSGRSVPHSQERAVLSRLAVKYAAEFLKRRKLPVPLDASTCCSAYLREYGR